MTFPYLVFIFIATLSGVSAEGPTKEDIEKSYKNIKPGEFACYYDGSLCKLGEEYCSIKPRTCESIFPTSASEKEKCDFCSEIIQKRDNEPGIYDGCIYYRGMWAIGKDYGKSDDKSNDNTMGLALGLGLGLGLGLPTMLIILAAAIIVYKWINKKKKNIYAPQHQQNRASGMDIGGDIDSKLMSEAKKENATNTVLDGARPAAIVPQIKPSERQ
uniref:Uncharacterized protein n=1 Tax=Arion vulgaris TaxID=1028688 RepID=A0A0B6ZXK0_9EUPU